MIVYGDIARSCTAEAATAEVHAALAQAAGTAGLDRHAALVAALIALGELLQGVADRELAQTGADAPSPAQDALAAALLALARAVAASWNGEPFDVPAVELPALEAEVVLKQPEGYAVYALYPEAFLAAARRLTPGEDWRVVGVRSIGTSLAAMVAAALEAPPPVSVRPLGHPFDRRLAPSPALLARITGGERVAVVDEGPGLSGSSFGAVLDTLDEAGVAADHVDVFPGHAGDLGTQAPPERRARWAAARRHVSSFDEVILPRLQVWAADRLGPATAPQQDISGGAWRALRFPESGWPPANPAQERRKFLHHTADGAWLLRFAGLGRMGERKLARARTLHAAGLAPEPAALLHGFLVERWIAPSPMPERRPPLAEYLSLRAGFAAAPDAGASAEAVFEMARINTAEALGSDAAEPLERFRPALPELQRRIHRIETDNRLHAWEWIAAPDGRWLKTDALDHHAAHDPIGAQDIAWDVAGAEIEWDLDLDETERLRRVVDADAALLDFYRPCYLAFQLGAYAMAAAAHEGAEAERLDRRRRFYQDRLARALTL